MKDIRQKLLAVFQAEHQDHLAKIRSVLEKCGAEGGIRNSQDLDEVFRSAHSLKGAARAVDLHEIETLSHRLETLFARVKSGTMQFDAGIIAVIHRVLDKTDDLAGAISGNAPAVDSAGVLKEIEALLAGEAAPAAAPVAVEKVREPVAAAEPAPVFKPVESLRVEARHLDRLLSSAGRMLEENSQQDVLSRELESLADDILQLERQWEPVRRRMLKASRKKGRQEEGGQWENRLVSVDQKLRVLAGKSRNLRNLQKRNSWSLRRLGEDLRDDIRQARMVPVGAVLEGFSKMMRDLARDEKKEIRFTMSGMELEADRMVLQALKDPLMHTLRNAVGHAIEPPEERQAKGKDRCGKVTLTCALQGSRLRISLADDGRGMNRSKLVETAVREGLLDSAAERVTDEDLMKLIFLPGFSTAPFITELSGRGMGLSVVAEELNRLQGTVAAASREHEGTEFVFSVPLTLSTSHVLLVGWQNQVYAIPSHGIEKTDRVAPSEIEQVEGRPVIRRGNALLPLATLPQLLEGRDAELKTDRAYVPLVILKSGGKRVALAVDEHCGQMDAFIKDLGFHLRKNRKYAGGLIRGDGTVALVLNPSELVEGNRHGAGGVRLQVVADGPGRGRRHSILVVDDSITTRTLEKSILEANGYEVTLAVDGAEALGVLPGLKPDLVISDVQMPKMDGFGLLENMKQNPDLRQIPFILLTSLESREDQERGLALGADAYVVKRKFDQRNLLETIRQIL